MLYRLLLNALFSFKAHYCNRLLADRNNSQGENGISLHCYNLCKTRTSWRVQSGTPLMLLKNLRGWKSVGMAPKYAHLP